MKVRIFDSARKELMEAYLKVQNSLDKTISFLVFFKRIDALYVPSKQ